MGLSGALSIALSGVAKDLQSLVVSRSSHYCLYARSFFSPGSFLGGSGNSGAPGGAPPLSGSCSSTNGISSAPLLTPILSPPHSHVRIGLQRAWGYPTPYPGYGLILDKPEFSELSSICLIQVYPNKVFFIAFSRIALSKPYPDFFLIDLFFHNIQ